MSDPSHNDLLTTIKSYYSDAFSLHGASAHGVDWNGTQSQELRFEHLARLLPSREHVSINDLGCGYGAFHTYLLQREIPHTYYGYELVPDMVAAAQRMHSNSGASFHVSSSLLTVADCTVASGIFNVKGSCDSIRWHEFVLETLHHMHKHSRRGFGFNLLTSHADSERMQPHLYYADPSEMLEYCIRHFSRTVSLHHGQGLYEYTVLVSLDGIPRRQT